MGKVSQHYMEEIEANHEFHCFKNPRFGGEPKPSIKEEIETTTRELEKRLRWCGELVNNLKKHDYTILDKIDASVEMVGYFEDALGAVQRIESVLKDTWEEKEREEKAEEEEALKDHEAMQDVYASVRASFL